MTNLIMSPLPVGETGGWGGDGGEAFDRESGAGKSEDEHSTEQTFRSVFFPLP